MSYETIKEKVALSQVRLRYVQIALILYTFNVSLIMLKLGSLFWAYSGFTLVIVWAFCLTTMLKYRLKLEQEPKE